MAKHVIRYLLDGDGSTPVFVSEGGMFQLGEELVGISVDDASRWLPPTVWKLTRQDLKDRIAVIAPPVSKSDSTPMSTQQISDLVDAYLSERGMGDYA